MPAKLFLKNLTIPSPCNADWNSMRGNDQVRFCEHCDLSVHNLSQLTRNQAQRLVARSNGRLCVRYDLDAKGGPILAPVSQKLYRISRRASRIAAGAFTATLSVTSAMAQSSQGSQSSQSHYPGAPSVSQLSGRWGLGSSLVGTVTDQNGAVIPGASVALSCDHLKLDLYTSSDYTGQFRVDSLEAGLYQLRIEAPGFAPEDVGGVYVQAKGETRVDRTLRIAALEASVEIAESGTERFRSMGGAVAYISPAHPFVKAAQQDDLETLASLISGTDVNMRDKRSDTTALEHAVRNANREMVQLLLSAGAKANARDSSGQTVLMMLDGDATSDLVWDLINAGAKVNLKDEGGNTALMEAASSDNLEAVKTLLDAGADLDTKSKQGRTALMLAASGGYVNIVRALILAGADVTAIDKDRKDALAYATEGSHKAVVRLLKSKGAVETVTQAVEEEEEEEEP
jgi:hypothetical protein